MPGLWYLAYGSNLRPELLQRYLSDRRLTRTSRWLKIDRALYFAGDSRAWGGPVAFLSLEATTNESEFTNCLAIAVTSDELQAVFRGENGLSARLGGLPGELAAGQWLEVMMRHPADPRQGKYNALLRGPDVDGKPSFTFSTARRLTQGRPTEEYLSAIRGGLSSLLDPVGATTYLERRISTAPVGNEEYLPSVRPGPSWSGDLKRGAFSGYATVRMPQSLAPVPGARNFLGSIRSAGNEIRAWVDFGLDDSDVVRVAASVLSDLGIEGASAHGTVTLDDVHTPIRLSGRLEDISLSDVVQVSADDEIARSRWALVVAPQLSAPVRVLRRAHVPKGMARIAYALRVLLSLDRGEPFALQPIRPITTSSRLRRAPRVLAEYVLGAPTIALRATEGLVGDDGRMVVRADPAALDFVGIQAGQEAVLTWADRAVVVRVLLQTEETRETMIAQLAESTGKQLRQSTSDPALRSKTPAHLRVWVSSSVRFALGVPPDTIVRLRRSIRHVLIRSASVAAVPAVGLVVAAAALDLPWWLWLSATVMLLFLVGLPLRLKAR